MDIAGGELRFGVRIDRRGSEWRGELCNGSRCQTFSAVRPAGDSVVLEMADYAATITARLAGDSLSGTYRVSWLDFPKADGTPGFEGFQFIVNWGF